MLFQIGNNGRLETIKEKEFRLEKDIQTLTEQNLATIFSLELVKSEFSLGNFRIDSLGFDRETGAFAIIEYKRDKNFSVIDQGYAYLSLMLNNKADFILEYNERFAKPLKRDDVDWSQTKVIFVSPTFTTYQREAINFKDLPIELWEIRKYENNTVSFNQIQKANAKESVRAISRKDDTIEQVSKEIKIYSEVEHLEKTSEEIKELYEQFKSAILNLGEVKIKPQKHYIAYSSGSNFVDIHIQQKALKMWLNLHIGELNDLKKLTRDVSKTGHWGNGDYEIQISNDENFDDIMDLIKQSYRKNIK